MPESVLKVCEVGMLQ